MLFFIQHDGREHQVRVEIRQGKSFVQFDEEPEQEIDLKFYGNDVSFIQNDKVFYGNVVGEKGSYTVWLPEGNLQFELESEYRRIVGRLRGQELTDENHVYAKMPGKIVKIQVKVGDVVEKGAPVMVMEAMKMENEIRAASSGEIVQIAVTEGQAVETGSLLIELKSSAE